MDREVSSMLLKANRVLGTRLVEAGLTKNDDMDRANALFVERARAKDLRRASLLWILIYESQTLDESKLMDYQLATYGLGALLLENYDVDPVILTGQSIDLMRASWTLPVDHLNGRWFLASAYYLSEVVRKYWEDQLGSRVSWMISPINQFEPVFEKLENDRAAADGGES
jgi:hypothetical protein